MHFHREEKQNDYFQILFIKPYKMTLLLRPSRQKGTMISCFLFLIFLLSFSSAFASGETIAYATAPGSPTPPFNPCGDGFGFQLRSYALPSGASKITQINWYYGNGILQGTTFDVTTIEKYVVKENDNPNGIPEFNVYAVVFSCSP
jgi:hypothetical protein